MGDAGDGWTTVHNHQRVSQAALDRLPWPEREAHELKVIREWESLDGHWSGVGKHVISLAEGRRLHSKFSQPADKDLGDGSYGRVEKVYRSVYMARKHIWRRKGRTIDTLREEVRVMEKLDHEHIVKVVGTYACEDNTLNILIWPVAVCTLQDFLHDIEGLRINKGNHADIVKRMNALDLKDLRAVDGQAILEDAQSEGKCPLKLLQQTMGCIAHAVTYCHRSNIRHLDIKPTNILLCPNRVYLADFGIARDVNDQDHTMTVGFQGSPKWQAPEALDMEGKWSMKLADIFSLGLIYLNIATILYNGKLSDFETALKNPYQPERRAQQLKAYHEQLALQALATVDYADDKAYTFAPRHLIGLTSRMLSTNPKSRPRADEVDTELISLGGIEQIYHSKCCKKSTRFVTSRALDPRLAVVPKLEAEIQRLAKRVAELEGSAETYEMRLVNERKHFQERLQKQGDEYQTKLRALEEENAQLQKNQNRRSKPGMPRTESSKMTPRPDPLGITNGLKRPLTHPVPVSAPQRIGVGKGLAPPQRRMPSDALPVWSGRVSGVSTRADSTPGPDSTPSHPHTPTNGSYPLRTVGSGSRLPILKDRHTPTRANTPTLKSDPSMSDSTQLSMNSSIFSHKSAETVPTPVLASPVAGKSPLTPQAAPDRDLLDKSSVNGGSIKSSSIIDEPTSPSISVSLPPSSTFSSPRMTKAEPSSLENGTVLKVPALQPGVSWADVASNTEGLAKMITDVAKDAAAKKVAAKSISRETSAKDAPIKGGGPRKHVRA